MSQTQRLATLEIGRGIAASIVALSHAASLPAEPRWFDQIPFDGALANMNVGVDFFFVLSGFIITFVHWNDFGRPDRLLRYIKRRFTRIFPAYWIILSLVVAVYLLKPSFGLEYQHNLIDIVASYLLIPMPEQPVLGVAWTLTYEVFFYALLGFVIFFGRRMFAIIALWGLVILICQTQRITAFPMSFFGSAYGLEFLLGILVAAIYRNYTVPGAGLFLIVGLFTFFIAAFFLPDIQLAMGGLYGRLVFGAASGLIILGAVTLENSGRLTVPMWLVPLGSASYAIYLSHPVAESALMRLIARTGFGFFTVNTVCIALAIAGIVTGFAFHFAIERPLTKFVRRHVVRDNAYPPQPSFEGAATRRRSPAG